MNIVDTQVNAKSTIINSATELRMLQKVNTTKEAPVGLIRGLILIFRLSKNLAFCNHKQLNP